MAKSRVSNLEDHVGYWLRYILEPSLASLQPQLGARGVTVAEWVMLRVLYDEKELAPSVLADRMGMTAARLPNSRIGWSPRP